MLCEFGRGSGEPLPSSPLPFGSIRLPLLGEDLCGKIEVGATLASAGTQ